MIEFQEALDIVQRADPLATRDIPLVEAVQTNLAGPIYAKVDSPPFDCSSVDGFAVAHGDIGQRFRLVEIERGEPLQPGDCVRIATGGKVPDGATAIVMKEDAKIEGDWLTAGSPISDGDFIRRKGGEFAVGTTLAASGATVSPALIGLGLGAGITTISAFPRPRVAVIGTGDELVGPGEPLPDGKVFESSSLALESWLQMLGYDCSLTRRVPDDIHAVTDAISAAMKESDVVLLTGGASVGPKDYTRPALRILEFQFDIEGVRMRPGKPFSLAHNMNKWAAALPGNPLSSLVCFRLFVVPLLEKLSGGAGQLPLSSARLRQDCEDPGGRLAATPALWEDGQIELMPEEQSHMLSGLAKANCLVIRQPGKVILKGETVPCVPLYSSAPFPSLSS